MMKKLQITPETLDLKLNALKQTRFEAIDEWIKQVLLDTNHMPGFHLLVSQSGKTLHESVQGFLDIQSRTALRPDAIYRIYSMTKPIVAVALMQLYEKGLFQLHDPLSMYCPEFADQKVWLAGEYPNMLTEQVRSPSTILQCLTHTAGFSYDLHRLSYVDDALRQYCPINGKDQDYDLATYIKELAKLPLQSHPGTEWLYSLSIDICGRLIEVLSGQTLAEYLQTHLFDPLEMVDTAYYVKKENLERMSLLYEEHTDGELKLSRLNQESTIKPLFEGGGSGLFSTIQDYHHFMQMLLQEGQFKGKRLLSRKTIDLIKTPWLNNQNIHYITHGMHFLDGYEVTQGLGLGLLANASHPSQVKFNTMYWGGLARTFAFVDPVHELIVCWMTQSIPANPHLKPLSFETKLRQMILASLN